MKARQLKKAFKKEAEISAGKKSARLTWREKLKLKKIREAQAQEAMQRG